jgi:hypothetical protein
MSLRHVPYEELQGRRIEQAYPLHNPCSDLDKFTA